MHPPADIWLEQKSHNRQRKYPLDFQLITKYKSLARVEDRQEVGLLATPPGRWRTENTFSCPAVLQGSFCQDTVHRARSPVLALCQNSSTPTLQERKTYNDCIDYSCRKRRVGRLIHCTTQYAYFFSRYLVVPTPCPRNQTCQHRFLGPTTPSTIKSQPPSTCSI